MVVIHNPNESDIRRIIERWADALRARDLDRMMTNYGTDVVTFDAVAPLFHSSIDEYRRNWEHRFEQVEGPIGVELRELTITADDSVGFAHAVGNLRAPMKHGGCTDVWLRWSSGWKKIGHWRIVHEHISAPFDLSTNVALLDLRP